MPRKPTPSNESLSALLPTRVRVSLTLYDHAGSGGYRQSGRASHADIYNLRELERLWEAVALVIDAGEWRDLKRRRTGEPA